MLKRFFPNEYVDCINDIDFKKLKRKKINGLIFDIDNTLVPHDIAEPPHNILNLFKTLKEMDFKVCLLSNNNVKRVTIFNKDLNLHSIPRAKKPLKSGITKAMALLGTTNTSTAIIGDQIFTDVWGGNRKGIYTILVKPLETRDEFTVHLKRGIERKVIDIYKSKI